jgi:hypothetical protein
MEKLIALAYDDAELDAAGNPHGETEAEKALHPGYEVTWEVTDLDLSGDGNDDSKEITVTVTAEGRGFQKPIELTSIRTDL